VDELASAQRDPDMRGTTADGLEEHQIPRLNVVTIELPSFVVLLSCSARKDSPVLSEDPLHEAAAVEPT
jgi:hypothetical protein